MTSVAWNIDIMSYREGSFFEFGRNHVIFSLGKGIFSINKPQNKKQKLLLAMHLIVDLCVNFFRLHVQYPLMGVSS